MNEKQPKGICGCGCGQRTPLAQRTERGLIKGEPVRYCPGHQLRGARWKQHTKPPPPNPSGLCECGCGETTPISKRTNRKKGLVEGEHARFIPGHNLGPRSGALNPFYGKHHTEETKRRIVENRTLPTGEAHPNWRGDDVGYFAAHNWLERNHGHEKVACEECGAQGVMLHWAYQGAPGGYSRKRSDYRVLCVSCHRKLDYGFGGTA